MRMSSMFIQTLREAPSDATAPGYQFLVRAGFIRGLGSGAYAWLPLGALARRRLAELAGTRLRGIGGQEMALPQVQSAELLHDLSDDAAAAVRFRDRNHRTMALAAAQERSVLALAAGVIQSYRQLPVVLYQIGPCYCDCASELNDPIAAREGAVLAVYSLHADEGDLREAYARVSETLQGIIREAAIPCQPVISDEDSARRAVGHRWLFPWPHGDHVYVMCAHCGYAADQEVARMAKPRPEPEPLQPMQEMATPDCKTIADLAAFLGIPESRTAKAVFLVAGFPNGEERFVFAVVRGDTTLNEAKLKKVRS